MKSSTCVNVVNLCFPLFQIMILRFYYFFTTPYHYYRIAFYVSVLSYLLPVNEAITAKQIGYGAVTVFLSWVNFIQYLKVVPVLGIYIILVEKVFWTLVKVRIYFFFVETR